MDASLKSVETAIYALAAELAKSASSPGPFSYVGRWLGPVLPDGKGALTIDREIAARSPALLVSPDQEAADDDVTTLAGDVETQGRSRWVLWVVLRDPRGANANATGAPSTPGIYDLIDTVVAALCNAPLHGGAPPVNLLIRDKRLGYRGFRFIPHPGVDANAHVVAGVFFEADRSVPTVVPADASVELTSTALALDLAPLGTDPVPPALVPLVSVTVST